MDVFDGFGVGLGFGKRYSSNIAAWGASGVVLGRFANVLGCFWALLGSFGALWGVLFDAPSVLGVLVCAHGAFLVQIRLGRLMDLSSEIGVWGAFCRKTMLSLRRNVNFHFLSVVFS